MTKVAIIGAGVAGLASAIRLKSKGYAVDVFEKNDYPGGKLTSIQLGKYRFDAGPSLFTLPHLVDELLELAGKNSIDFFAYKKLDISCRYFWEDGTQLDAYEKAKDFAIEVHQKLGVHPSKIAKHLERSAEIYELTKNLFLKKSLHKFKTYFSFDTLNSLANFHKIHAFTSLNKLNEKYLGDKRLVQLFNRFATYNGSNPYKAPGTLLIVPHLEHGIGAYFPQGGMKSITEVLFNVAKEMGVNFYFNKAVEEIIENKRRVEGLKIEGELLPYTKVVSNMDVNFVYSKLLPNVKTPSLVSKQEKSSSALIFYWGIKKQFPQLDLHNIFFSESYKEEFDCIFEKKTIFNDPTVYVNISSKYNLKDAPKGGENWFTMINVPSNSNQDWKEIIPKAKHYILQKLSRILKDDISILIEEESILDPLLIESKTMSHAGALYGSSSNSKFSAFMRHPNFSRKIKGLYFCGGSVHPGGGIPLCLLSAKLVSEHF